MKYKDGGTSMLTKLERLVRLKGMVDVLFSIIKRIHQLKLCRDILLKIY